MQPYEPPETNADTAPELAVQVSVPGRISIWSIAGLSFCIGVASLFGAWVFWRRPELLGDLSGSAYYYYTLRPVAFAIGFLGLSWKCFRYVDAVDHNAMGSPEVRLAHGGVWNWMAVMMAAFVMLVAYHSLGG